MKIYKYNCTKTCISQDYRQPYITMLIYWISVDFAIQIFIFYEVCVLTKKVWGKQQNVFTGSCVLHIFDTGLVYTKIARKRKKKKKRLLSCLFCCSSTPSKQQVAPCDLISDQLSANWAEQFAAATVSYPPVTRLETTRGRMSIFSILIRISPGKAMIIITSGGRGDMCRSSIPEMEPRNTPEPARGKHQSNTKSGDSRDILTVNKVSEKRTWHQF